MSWILIALLACSAEAPEAAEASRGSYSGDGASSDGGAAGGDTGGFAGDDARIAASYFPAQLACGEAGVASVTVENTGGTTWTHAGGYSLGAVGDEDPLYTSGVRVYLDQDAAVAPGSAVTLVFPLDGPDSAGSYTTDWRMLREGAAWFGESVEAAVEVACAGGDTGGTGGTSAGDCVGESFPGPYTMVEGAPQFAVALAAEEGVEYARFSASYTVNPYWGGLECNNTYFDPPVPVEIYHRMATLQYGDHWCAGGNLFNVNGQGPGKDKLNVWVWDVEPGDRGDGCAAYELVETLQGASFSLPEGAESSVAIALDMAGPTLDFSMNGTAFSAPLVSDNPLRADSGYPLTFVLSFDREPGVHCADEDGVEDPANEQCCWPPSYGWVFSDIRYELCR